MQNAQGYGLKMALDGMEKTGIVRGHVVTGRWHLMEALNKDRLAVEQRLAETVLVEDILAYKQPELILRIRELAGKSRTGYSNGGRFLVTAYNLLTEKGVVKGNYAAEIHEKYKQYDGDDSFDTFSHRFEQRSNDCFSYLSEVDRIWEYLYDYEPIKSTSVSLRFVQCMHELHKTERPQKPLFLIHAILLGMDLRYTDTDEIGETRFNSLIDAHKHTHRPLYPKKYNTVIQEIRVLEPWLDNHTKNRRQQKRQVEEGSSDDDDQEEETSDDDDEQEPPEEEEKQNNNHASSSSSSIPTTKKKSKGGKRKIIIPEFFIEPSLIRERLFVQPMDRQSNQGGYKIIVET